MFTFVHVVQHVPPCEMEALSWCVVSRSVSWSVGSVVKIEPFLVNVFEELEIVHPFCEPVSPSTRPLSAPSPPPALNQIRLP